MAVGIDSYTKLLIHANGTDAATFVPDSSNLDNYVEQDYKTVLMLHFDGADAATTTKDAATNKAVTFVGTAQLDTAQSKFGGSSLLLDGNSDGLTLAADTGWNWGSGDINIDLWVRWATVATSPFISQQATGDRRLFMYYHDTTELVMYEQNSGVNIRATWAPVADTWYHVCYSKSSGTSKLFVNGTSLTLTTATEATFADLTSTMQIGTEVAFGRYHNGWIDDFRIIKGKALYTANFTPPTVSPSPKDVTCVGNAQIDTAQKEFGTGSILFDGTGDYLSLADSDDWAFGSGNFTIDGWVRFSAYDVNNGIANASNDNNSWTFWVDNDNANNHDINFSYSTDGTNWIAYSVDWTYSLNTWYHLAVVRNGVDLKIFVDGTQIGVTHNIETSILYDSSGVMYVGGGQSYFNGWIDEFRISKGVARWTSNFTVPDSEYTPLINCTVTPTALALTATVNAPVNVIIEPIVYSSLFLTLHAPTIVISPTPTALPLTLTLNDPDIVIDDTEIISATSLTLTVHQPLIKITPVVKCIPMICKVETEDWEHPYENDPVVTSGCPSCGTLLYK